MTEVVEVMAEVFTLRPGDEIRVDGRWLEIQALKSGGLVPIPVSNPHITVITYDEVENRQRSFACDPYVERRVRQPVEIAS